MKVAFAESLPMTDPTGAVLEGRTVAALVADSLRRNGVNPAAVITAVDRSAATVRRLSLPPAPDDELERMIQYEAESHVPFPLDSAEMAHTHLPPEDGLARIVVAACPRQTVAARRAPLEEAGASVTEVAVSTVATYNCLLRTDAQAPTGTHLLVDIGAETTEVAVIANGELASSLTLAQGGQSLTLAFARDHNTGSDEAERRKAEGAIELDTASGLPSDPELFSTTAWFQKLVGGLSRSIEAHNAGHEDSPVGSIVLLGGGSALPGLSDALSGALDLPIRYADPLAALGYSPAESSAVYSPAMATAAGLAMQGVGLAELELDLTPKEILAQRRAKARRGVGQIAGIAFAAALILATLWQGWQWMGARNEYRAELEDLRQAQTSLRGMTLHPAEVLALESIVTTAASPENDPLDLMELLADELPLEVSIRDISFRRNDSLEMRGTALSNAAVADAVMALKRSGRFDSVELTHSTATEVEGATFYSFAIECGLPGGDAS
jgi:type IV pilus assembly protein PilM